MPLPKATHLNATTTVCTTTTLQSISLHLEFAPLSQLCSPHSPPYTISHRPLPSTQSHQQHSPFGLLFFTPIFTSFFVLFFIFRGPSHPVLTYPTLAEPHFKLRDFHFWQTLSFYITSKTKRLRLQTLTVFTRLNGHFHHFRSFALLSSKESCPKIESVNTCGPR